MFKAELDRLHRAEQFQDYLREGESAGRVQQNRHRQVTLAGSVTLASVSIVSVLYWIATTLLAAGR